MWSCLRSMGDSTNTSKQRLWHTHTIITLLQKQRLVPRRTIWPYRPPSSYEFRRLDQVYYNNFCYNRKSKITSMHTNINTRTQAHIQSKHTIDTYSLLKCQAIPEK